MPRLPSPTSLASQLRQLIASPPGTAIELPQAEHQRASIHVALSRLRREYEDLMGPDLSPSVSLTLDPVLQVWIFQYCGLTERGRLPKPQRSYAEDLERKRKIWRERNRRRADRLLSRLALRIDSDPGMREDAPLGYEPLDVTQLREDLPPAKATQAVERAERAAQRAKPKPVRLPTPTEIQDELTRIANAITYHEERLDLVEARLEEAREAKTNAKKPHELSVERQAAIARGEVSCRYDRAQVRIDKYMARIEHYETHIARLEKERQQWKNIRDNLKEISR